MAGARKGVGKAPGGQPVLTGRITRASRTPKRAITVLPSVAARAISAQTESASSPAHGSPPTWAESRPELCDALPWFRSLQGGCYYVAGHCWGFLVDADCGVRSYMDDEVVITRIGGGCEKDEQGNLVQTKEHTGRSVVFRSLTNSMRHEVPVGLVIGNQNSICATRVPHRYNVLDFFRITDIWFEKVGGKAGARVRFEKLDLESKSWWAAKEAEDPVSLERRSSISPAEKLTCEACSLPSPRIYEESWMCLEPTCERFWTVGGLLPPVDLSYAPQFLKMRSRQRSPVKPPCSLVPNLLSTFADGDVDVASARVVWKGIVCPLCKRCISRKYWRGWICETQGCDFRYDHLVPPVSLRSVISELEMGPVGHRIPYVGNAHELVPEMEYMKNYRKDIFGIPGEGLITHFAANNTVNCRPGGPNDIFKQLQLEDLGLRRYPLQQSVVAGTLTSHFAVNYGMPYKYVVSVDSRPFKTAPPVILAALGRLTWATKQTVKQEEFLKPNELLSLGYFEEMAIGYHDDGETSLGPTIATLSLGGKATMSIRMKDKYYNGCGATKKPLANDPVLPGCAKYEEKKALQKKLRDGDITEEEYEAGRKEILATLKRKEAPPFCVMELNHGDLVVMHGANLQKHYEHAVVPGDRLRFAMTARYIKPEQVDPSEHWKGDFTPDPAFEYDGDE